MITRCDFLKVTAAGSALTSFGSVAVSEKRYSAGMPTACKAITRVMQKKYKKKVNNTLK